MLPELAHLSLILSVIFSALLAIFPCAESYTHRRSVWQSMVAPLALLQWFGGMLAYILLTSAFWTNDFSVAYVAQHSHRGLPLIYRICAVWGAHEGSLLLWLCILHTWMLLFLFGTKTLSPQVRVRSLSVLAALAAALGFFMLSTSNPFLRLLPQIPLEGGDLNPLLQDIGFILHPPCLYLGYVGFAVPFALSVGALLTDNTNAMVVFRAMRVWALAAWACLTLGIALGSWWAYYELGWGGWWFWDPVENAALMPWIVGGALVHALQVAQTRQLFYRWILLLAIFCCGLSLLGTFLVRSGILSSVHSFASDPERGRYLLYGVGFFMGGALLIFGCRHPAWAKASGYFTLLSRESLLLLNNVLLCAVAGMILLGTLYPLVLELYFHQQASVGAPYFNRFFIPMMSVLFVIMGLAPGSIWGKNTHRWVKEWGVPAIVTLLGTCYFGRFEGWRSLGIALSLWIVSTTIALIWLRKRPWTIPRLGMIIAHVGIAVTIVGITMSSLDSIEKDVGLLIGESDTIGGYTFHLIAITPTEDLHTKGVRAHLEVFQGNSPIAQLFPEKRYFTARQMATTETALDPGLWRDLYVAMGDALPENGWYFRIYIKPFIRWIWLGALMVALGAFLSLFRRTKSVS